MEVSSAGTNHPGMTVGRERKRIADALSPVMIATLCFASSSALALDPTNSAAPAFAPQINLATPISSIRTLSVRKHRLTEPSPRANAKSGCPITAESHYLFC
jgi:hypothetical protein